MNFPTPQQLAEWSGGFWTKLPTGHLSGCGIDSRKLNPGELFIALSTEQRDGHDFVAAAESVGAGAAMVSRAMKAVQLPQLVVTDTVQALHAIASGWRRQFTGSVIAITGSCGKTSSKDLLRLLLGEEQCLATEANLNNTLGVPLTLLRIDPTKHRWAVIEAGINQPGEMELIGKTVRANAVLLTMIGAAHLEGLGSLEGVAREKSYLLTGAHADAVCYFPGACLRYAAIAQTRRSSVLFFQDKNYTADQPVGTGSRIVHFSTNYSCSTEPYNRGVRDSVSLLLEGVGTGTSSFLLPRMSPGMLSNAAMVITIARDLGIPDESIQERIQNWQPARNRGELRQHGARSYYLDCYNANPSSLNDSVQAFCALFPNSPRVFVIGGMRELGEHSDRWHREAGRSLPLACGDSLVAVGTEAQVLVETVAALPNPPQFIQFAASAAEAAQIVQALEGPVFLKGSRAYALESIFPIVASAPIDPCSQN